MPMTNEEIQQRVNALFDGNAKDLDTSAKDTVALDITARELLTAHIRIRELEGQIVVLQGWMREIRARSMNVTRNTRATRAMLISEQVEIEDIARFALEGKKKG